ncbi:SCO4402 family protein [Actinosynnema sp. CS-041913]|uniref:SCO4402 family protein n=1 Tax=Actinosynnema sp. CS-041913 TaxID=3239917 RepID=UPI003D93249C
MIDVEYPEMRAEIVGAVRSLSDPEHQRRVWVRREMPHPNYHDYFDLNIHILYDDTTVFADLSGAIGAYLRDEGEARALGALKDALEALFDKHGLKLTDEEYIGKPEWTAVVESARDALRVLTAD